MPNQLDTRPRHSHMEDMGLGGGMASTASHRSEAKPPIMGEGGAGA